MKRIIFLASLLLVFVGMNLHAQGYEVTGKVTSSEDGSALPGVSVVLQGTTIGTVTDFDGNYSINVPEGSGSLMFSFVGMETQAVELDGRTVIDVQLNPAAERLDEVVVTALGIKRSEKAIGYAVTTFDSDEITKTRSTDLMGSLSGKVAGVDISVTSSSPGASNAVIIRGMSSLGGSNQPLYVVDGVPIINTANFTDDGLNSAYDFGAGNQMVNPDDVESVSILKGAAASALYGNRASNGVVLITTKSGQLGQGIEIEINSGYEMSDVARLPQLQNQFGMGWDGHHTFLENGSWGPEMDGTMRLWGSIYNYSQKKKPFSALPNNMYDFFEYGTKYQNSVAVSGGSQNTTFYTSFSQSHQDGVIPSDKDSFDKYTFSFNGSHTYKNLTLRANANLSRQSNSFVPTGQGFTVMNNISQIPRDVSIVDLADLDDPFNTIDYYFTPYGVINPYWALENLNTTYQGQKIFGKIEADYKIIDGLNIMYRLGFDASDNEQKNAFPRIVTTAGTPNEGEVSEPGYSEKQMSRRTEINQDLFLTFNKSFGDITVDALAGTNILARTTSTLFAGVGNLDIPDFFDLQNTAETPTINEYSSQKRMIGLLANATVSYQDVLFLTLSGRQDYTSTLPAGNNSYFYPGTQLSFNFSELLPSNLQDVVSFGKLRASWGKVGKDADVYLLNRYFVQGNLDNPFGDILFPLVAGDALVNAYEVGNRLSNTALQPEIRTETEFGMAMDFFQRRFGLDVAYYNSISNNQIFNLGLDPSTGYTSQTTNISEISNKGIEAMVYVKPIRTGDFEWEITGTFTKNNEKLVSLPEELGEKIAIGGLSTIGFVAQVGQPLGVFEVTVPQKTATGEIVVDDDGQPVAAAEKALIPKAAYDYMVGVVNTVTWKGLRFSFDVDVRQGGLIYSRTKDINLFTGNLAETVYNNRDPFIVPNSVRAIPDEDGEMDADGSYEEDYITNDIPIKDDQLVTYFSNGQDKLDEAMLLPRSFVRLKRVTLGYTFEPSFLTEVGIKSLTLSAYGNNLMLWTPAENYLIDPEASTFGNDLESKYGEFSANPPTRHIGVNVNLRF